MKIIYDRNGRVTMGLSRAFVFGVAYHPLDSWFPFWVIWVGPVSIVIRRKKTL